MKLPQSFRIEKDLEDKTEQLVNYAKRKPWEPNIDVQDSITFMAVGIALQYGIIDQEWTPKPDHKAYIRDYTDSDLKFKIFYQYEVDKFDDVQEYYIKVFHNSQIVFERNHKRGIVQQIEGEWLELMSDIYNK